MKKYGFILIIIVGVFMLAGCDSNEAEKIMTCTRKATITQGVEADLTYQVTYQGKEVQKVSTIEKVSSDNTQYLELYKSTIENAYSPYENVEHYDYEVKVENNVMTSKVNIDYAKIDTEKLISIDSANASLIKNGKVKIADMKSLYEQIGATCK